MTEWPGGMNIFSGGTRNEINLSRPWQREMIIDPNTCPLENIPQTVIAEYKDGLEKWRVIKTTNTPYPFHLLIIPERCWGKEKLQTLGGFLEVRTALAILEDILREYRKDGTIILGVHVGYAAGQNTGHLHWHIIELPQKNPDDVTEKKIRKCAKNPSLLILDDRAISVVAGGQRGGQCFFVPKGTENTLHGLALNLVEIIHMYNDKFMSTEGLPPEYMVGLKFRKRGFMYGFYIPILNHLGFPEYFSLLGEEPRSITLPWPHEKTVAHLKGAGR